MLKLPTKASQIHNLTDARYFAAWGVDWLGFDLNEAPLASVKAIKEWVEGPKIVGEFGIQNAEEIKEIVKALNLDAIQVGMLAGLDLVKDLEGISIFKEVVVEDLVAVENLPKILAVFAPFVKYFILNFDKNGISYSELNAIHRKYLAELCTNNKIILSIHFDPKEMDVLIDEVKPYGISLAGGAEEKVGFKSFDELDDIFEALEDVE